MSKDLPRDIIIDILSRLPVTSLLRFKSVSKSWYALFQNPNFITKHFQNQNQNQNQTLINSSFLYTRYQPTTRTVTLLSLSNHNKSVDVPIIINIPFLRVSKPLRVSGSCNGLICLSVLPIASIILLWNPATRVFKDLPVSRIDRPQAGPIKVVLGFGFDSNANDYKVLRIVYYGYPLNQVEMYSLSTNSWKEIKARVRFLIFESSCSVFLKGNFHWSALAFEEMNGRKVIVSFDMADETFRYIMPPNDYDDDSNDSKVRWTLVVLMESLAVIGSVGGNGNGNGNGRDYRKFDIWVMNEYGETGSWMKYKSFELRTRLDRPLVCGLNGELLLEKDDGELVLYDSTAQTIKNLGKSHGVACWSDVFNHVGSLLPIKGGRTNLSEVIPDVFFVRKFDLELG